MTALLDTLNPDQREALDSIKTFLASDAFEMVLKGQAGTGKTYVLQAVVETVKKRIVFTAPTNKAVKVLRDMLKTEAYRPDCRTIYSLLGLQLMAEGEVKVIGAPKDEPDLSSYSIVVVDEASMVNKVLRYHIKQAQTSHPKIKWIFVGDAWQLPPVGEESSSVWDIPLQVTLTQIMRQDNSIIQLAGQVRGLIETPMRALILKSTDDVKALSTLDFMHSVLDASASLLAGTSKVAAWRNVRVDEFNKLVRKQLFAEPEKYPWQPGDRITVLEPVKDMTDNDREGPAKILATTDDEGVVESADIASHPEFSEFECWRIVMRKDDNQLCTLWTLHIRSQGAFTREVARLASAAKTNRKLWGLFWEFKDAFHKVRHAYAITSHRAQGSTYEKAYVNWRDIMLNQNRSEAYRSLYVAVSRPKKELYLG